MTFAEILARQFSLSQYAEFFIRVLIACVCGAAIGYERSKRLKEAGIRMEISTAAKAYLVERGYDPEYGARPLRRTISRLLEDRFSEEILSGNLRRGDTVFVDVQNGALGFRKG